MSSQTIMHRRFFAMMDEINMLRAKDKVYADAYDAVVGTCYVDFYSRSIYAELRDPKGDSKKAVIEQVNEDIYDYFIDFCIKMGILGAAELFGNQMFRRKEFKEYVHSYNYDYLRVFDKELIGEVNQELNDIIQEALKHPSDVNESILNFLLDAMETNILA